MNSKEKIIAKASRLIHTKGFNNTSIQDILDDASVTKSNFYYHFESKEQLGFEVLARRMEWFYKIAVAPSLDNPQLNPAERIDEFLNGVLRLSRLPEGELGCPFGNLAQEMSAIHEPLRLSLSEFFRVAAIKLEQCFEDGKKTGVFNENMPSKRFAEFVLAHVQGSFLLRKTHKDYQIMESNIDLLRELIKRWS